MAVSATPADPPPLDQVDRLVASAVQASAQLPARVASMPNARHKHGPSVIVDLMRQRGQTLRGIRGMEPFHWSGTREDTQAFRKTFTGFMAGTGLAPPELDALAAFVDSLQPIASPVRGPDGSLTAVAGAAVFLSAGCVSCHAPPLFTDRQLHDVGTGAPFHDRPAGAGKLPEARGGAFKTPPLRELWLTAPYLHDGRAATLRDAIRAHTRSALSEPQLADLEAFLLQLPLIDAEIGRIFAP